MREYRYITTYYLLCPYLIDCQVLAAVSRPILPASSIRVGQNAGEELVEDDSKGVNVALEAEGILRLGDDFRGHPKDGACMTKGRVEA